MINRFNKKQIPFLTQALGNGGSARDLFWVAHNPVMHNESYSWQQDRVLFAYERSAHAGDDWSMHALAMNIINDPIRFPEALSWLHHSIRAGNENCLNDVRKEWDHIYRRIFTYDTHYGYDYPDLEVKCALITDFILIKLGADKWENLDQAEKESRIKTLCHEASILLDIPSIDAEFFTSLTDSARKTEDPDKSNIDGLAYLGCDKIAIKKSALDDYQRLIQVIFHELGHQVIFYAMQENSPHHIRLLRRLGLEEDHIEKWKKNEIGYEITLTEEDPDTLSYGVWWTYLLYFGDRGLF